MDALHAKSQADANNAAAELDVVRTILARERENHERALEALRADASKGTDDEVEWLPEVERLWALYLNSPARRGLLCLRWRRSSSSRDSQPRRLP